MSSLSHLHGRAAVITGAAGAIGTGIARVLGELGMTLVLVDVDPGALEVARSGLVDFRSRIRSYACDVSDSADVARMAADVLSSFGSPGVVCSNAGTIGSYAEVWSQSDANWRWVLGVNLLGASNLARSFVPPMLDDGGRTHFVVTASDAGFGLRPLAGPYQVSKRALVAFAETLSIESRTKNPNFSVHLLSPGGVHAPRLMRGLPPELLEKVGGGLQLSGDSPSGALVREASLEWLEQEGNKQTGDEVAQSLISGIERGLFYIFPDATVLNDVKDAYDQVISGGMPLTSARFRTGDDERGLQASLDARITS
jgi:NAD(P)-dependent dehydrogenase (short-subunit alcohol dehydrogenase family)